MPFGRPAPPSRWDALPALQFQDDYVPSRQASTRRTHRDAPASSSNFESSLHRSNARSGTHASTTRDWGSTNSNMDLRASYARDMPIGQSSTTSRRSPTRTPTTRSRSSTSTLRPNSILYEPGVDLTNYNGGSFNSVGDREPYTPTRWLSTVGEASSATTRRDTSHPSTATTTTTTTRRDSTRNSSRYDTADDDLTSYCGDVSARGGHHDSITRTRRSDRPSSDRSFASRVASRRNNATSVYPGRQSRFREEDGDTRDWQKDDNTFPTRLLSLKTTELR